MKTVHHQLNEDEVVIHDKYETGSPLEVRLANRNSNRRISVPKDPQVATSESKSDP
jgi:hypothetical protein